MQTLQSSLNSDPDLHSSKWIALVAHVKQALRTINYPNLDVYARGGPDRRAFMSLRMMLTIKRIILADVCCISQVRIGFRDSCICSEPIMTDVPTRHP